MLSFENGSKGILTIQEEKFGNNIAFQVIKILSDKYQGIYTYNIGNEYLNAKIQLDYATTMVKSYMTISCMQLLLISFCSSGIFLIIFSKRKKDIAISIMLGSTLLQQLKEIVLEIISIILLGVSFGFISFYIAIGNSEPVQLKMILSLFIVSISITIISSSLTLKDINKLNPIEALQKN